MRGVCPDPKFSIRMGSLIERGLLSEITGDDPPVPTAQGQEYFCSRCQRKVSIPAFSPTRRSRNLAVILSRVDFSCLGIRTADIERAHVPGRRI